MPPTFEPELYQRVAAARVVAVLTVDRAEDGAPLARALLAGGIAAMELTLRTPAALDALRRIREEVPEMLAGVGTILTPEQADQAAAAGAAFGVSPGFNPRVVEAARARGLSFAPGICTPSDVEAALAMGCRLLKFFPAEPSGGMAYLESIAAPYAHLGVRYLPLGGVTVAKLPEYFASPLIAAVGGSWIAGRDAIREGNWAAITARAQEAAAASRRVPFSP